MEYEWDPEKDLINQRLHGSTVFLDALAATVPDERFDVNELSFRTVGYTLTNHLVMVAHTDRGDRIRIISARPVTGRERREYEQHS